MQLWQNMFFNIQLHFQHITLQKGFPGGSDSKKSASNMGDPGSIPGLGRFRGGGHGNPLQFSGLEKSMDYSMGSQKVGHD